MYQQTKRQNNTYDSITSITQKTMKIVQKLRILINLQISNNQLKQNHSCHEQSQLSSIKQVNVRLIKQLFRIFQNFKHIDSQQRINAVQKYLLGCDKIVKIFQIQVIDSIETLMKQKEITQLQNMQNIYQNFYILCSQYMNINFQHSNQLCLMLSQQTKLATARPSQKRQNLNNFKEVGQCINNKRNTNKQSNSVDYYLLKHLLQRTSKAKKMYQKQINQLEDKVAQLGQKIAQFQTENSNLRNRLDELIQDFSQLQQIIQNGSIDEAREVLSKINSEANKKVIGNQKTSSSTKKIGKNQQSMNTAAISEQKSSQIQILKQENRQISQKLSKYKNQIHRSAWIISVQSRQMYLLQQRNKQLQKQFQNYLQYQNIDVIKFKPVI